MSELALLLDKAQRTASPISRSTNPGPTRSAYDVQHELVARRVQRGERPVGIKLGFTSAAKMKQMGVSEVIIGQLTDAMHIDAATRLSLSTLIHPRVEPEIAFRVSEDFDRADDAAKIKIDAFAPALEIIDSRYADFKFSLFDVIADNTSAAAFVVGEWILVDASTPDFIADQVVTLELDGVEVEKGTTAAILGHPMNAIGAAEKVARAYEFPVRRGDILLAGAATPAVPLRNGVASASISNIGRVSVEGMS